MHDPAQEIVVLPGPLAEMVERLYVKAGMYPGDAKAVAAIQVETDLRGVFSHGTRFAPAYCRAMLEGHIDPRAEAFVEREGAAFAVLNGAGGLGHVAGIRAMQTAIDKARTAGTGTVLVRQSAHYGPAAAFVLMACEAGMIGMTTSNTAGPTVAPYGSRQPALANNPIAWGLPVRQGAPVVLDMACAVSSWGKIGTMRLYGEKLPPGWALDAEGRETLDPAIAKTLLPAAGARGSGLAFVCAALCGPLAGGRMPLHKTSWLRDPSEHFFQAIDVAQFVEPEKYYAELESTIAEIRRLPPAEGFDRVTLPGELEGERSQRWRSQGIPLHRDHLAPLAEIGRELGVPAPWE